MTNDVEPEEKPEETEEDSAAMRALLNRALASPKQDTLVLPEVQRKLRQRSRGKFYGTSWSASPPSKVAIAIAIVMLIAAAVVAWLMSPRV